MNTGNLKFFVHGLEFQDQLYNFFAFALPDSPALLSASYAVLPKYLNHFFRSQGVIMNVNSRYIHGGGASDTGSGCKKTVEDFKRLYLFGGNREFDRSFVGIK